MDAPAVNGRERPRTIAVVLLVDTEDLEAIDLVTQPGSDRITGVVFDPLGPPGPDYRGIDILNPSRMTRRPVQILPNLDQVVMNILILFP